MGKIFTIVTQKGGVGKTATAYNLAYVLASLGKKTLLVDIDPNHNSSDPFISTSKIKLSMLDLLLDKNLSPEDTIYPARLKGKQDIINNLFILPSNLELGIAQNQILARAHKERLLLKQLLKIKHLYDYILIDSPQSICDLAILAVYAGEFLIIPLEYANDSIKAINHVFLVMNEVKEDQDYDFKILRNNRDSRNAMVSKVESQIEDFIKISKVFNTVIRKDEQINRAKDEELPVIVFSPKSRASEDYMALAKEIINE